MDGTGARIDAARFTTETPNRFTLTSGVRRRLEVIWALSRSDLKIRYGRGVWQLGNWLINPFAQVGVYLLLRLVLSRDAPSAALSIACAVVPFQLIVLTVESSMSAVSLREPVLLNRSFDRLLLPITMIVGGVAPTWTLLWLPVVVAATLVLALGVAWPATLLGMWFPTIKVVVSQAVRVLFFAAAGIIALREMSDDVRRWIVFNPLTGLFESFRHVVLYGEHPDFWQLAYPVAIGVLLGVVFIPIYRREQRHFAKLVRS